MTRVALDSNILDGVELINPLAAANERAIDVLLSG